MTHATDTQHPGNHSEYASVERQADPAYQGYQILHWGFVALPTLVGLDKFTDILANWDAYLAPVIARLSPLSVHAFMQAVGVVEIVAGLLVAVRPRVGGIVVATWLAGIIANLVLAQQHYDVAMRDFGLLLGALALSRIATVYERRGNAANG